MNKQNVIKAAMTINKAGFNSKLADAKIEQGFVDGDVIPMGKDRIAKVEDGKLVGYNNGAAEGSYVIADLPAAHVEQIMAAYIANAYSL